MMFLDRAAGVALALAAMAAIVWASNAATTVHGSDDGVLRLAWSARPERVEVCREQTEDEQAKLPRHMRQPVVCEGTSAHYRLTVRAEGQVVIDQIVRGGGLRQDRRLYVFGEFPLQPGEASIEVRFDRVDSGSAPASGPLENEPPAQRQPAHQQAGGEAIPPRLVFERHLRVRPRDVILVTYSLERRALIALQDGSPAEQ